MLLILLILALSVILLIELPGLIKNRLYREIWVFSFLFLIGTYGLRSALSVAFTQSSGRTLSAVGRLRRVTMQQTWAVILVLLMLLSSGCGTMTDVERTAVGAGLGVDLDNENNVLFYAQFNRPVNVQETGANEAQSEVFTGRGKTPTQAARNITLGCPTTPVVPCGYLCAGRKAGSTDLYYMADFLSHNRNIRKTLLVVAYKVSPYDIFHGECPFALCSSRGIINILRAQDKTSVFIL